MASMHIKFGDLYTREDVIAGIDSTDLLPWRFLDESILDILSYKDFVRYTASVRYYLEKDRTYFSLSNSASFSCSRYNEVSEYDILDHHSKVQDVMNNYDFLERINVKYDTLAGAVKELHWNIQQLRKEYKKIPVPIVDMLRRCASLSVRLVV